MWLAKSISDSVFMPMNPMRTVADSLLGNAERLVGFTADSVYSVEGHFIQDQSLSLMVERLSTPIPSWIYYSLFAFLAFLAFVRFFYPQALTELIGIKMKSGRTRSGNESNLASGFMVPAFLFLNFIVTVVLLAYAWMNQMDASRFTWISSMEWLPLFAIVLLAYSFFNLIVSAGVGFLFSEKLLASAHYQIAARTSYLTGLMLTPLMLIYFYNPNPILLWIGVSILLIFLLLKWFNLFAVGLSQRIYGPVHFFLYLCTVEILPLLLLLKEGFEYLHVG
jgi:hypothetical protein